MGALRPVTIGIAGTGTVSHDLVCATLCDHFEMGPEDSSGYFAPSQLYDIRVMLPVSAETYTRDIEAVFQWVMRCELRYEVINDGTEPEFVTTDVLKNVLEPDDTIMVSRGETYPHLLAHLADAPNPMLLVLSTEGKLDPAAQEAAADALRRTIPVYDLSRALLEIGWHDLPDHQAPEPTPPLVTDPDGQIRLALVQTDTPELVLTGAEVGLISAALDEVERLLVRLEALRDDYPAIRKALIHARAALLPRPEPSAEPAGRTRLEIFDEASGRWVPAGRGRPKTDVQKRRVPIARNSRE